MKRHHRQRHQHAIAAAVFLLGGQVNALSADRRRPEMARSGCSGPTVSASPAASYAATRRILPAARAPDALGSPVLR